MSKLVQQHGLWTRFKKDTQGNLTLVWAFGLTAAMMAIGAGIDISSTARVSTTAQAAADQVALQAAVFYSNNERLPENSDEGYMDGVAYNGDDAGFNFPYSVHGGDENVSIIANYDELKGEVTVEVSGSVETAFMSLFNKKYETLDFSSEATAKFKNLQIKNPASISLVLDNSGSMAWDDLPAECRTVWVSTGFGRGFYDEQCESPNDAARRIDGLKDSVEDFMAIIENVVGPQAVTGKRVLRTGMIPYDNSIINSRVVEMDWGIISNDDIDRMAPSGATNSAPPIAQAWEDLAKENDIHEAETNEDNPLRYMIFMTDGQNSLVPLWNAKSGTGYWRGIECTTNRRRNFCYYRYATSSSTPNIQNTHSWQEGENLNASDVNSKNSCQAMKNQGVRVFTIGFALEPGTYLTNYRSTFNDNRYPEDHTQEITSATTEAAYALLADCASSNDDFVPAADVESLEAAFQVIGETIIEEVVRLSF